MSVLRILMTIIVVAIKWCQGAASCFYAQSDSYWEILSQNATEVTCPSSKYCSSANDFEFSANTTGYSFYTQEYYHCSEFQVFHDYGCEKFGSIGSCQVGEVKIENAYYVNDCDTMEVIKYDEPFTYSQRLHCCEGDGCNDPLDDNINADMCVVNDLMTATYQAYYDCALSMESMSVEAFADLLFCGGQISTCDHVITIMNTIGKCQCEALDLIYKSDENIVIAADVGCGNATWVRCDYFTDNIWVDQAFNAATILSMICTIYVVICNL